MSHTYYVYILASRKYGALYIGVTSDLVGRVYVHREELVDGHTSRYRIHDLVYFEVFEVSSRPSFAKSVSRNDKEAGRSN